MQMSCCFLSRRGRSLCIRYSANNKQNGLLIY